MTDRELLELAAKAASIEIVGWHTAFAPGPYSQLFAIRKGNAEGQRVWWNPLTDDGDALRLAVTLHLIVQCNPVSTNAGVWFPLNKIHESHGDNPERATRRAIVRAAAEIGRAMKDAT